jgi:hypothetical protein
VGDDPVILMLSVKRGIVEDLRRAGREGGYKNILLFVWLGLN